MPALIAFFLFLTVTFGCIGLFTLLRSGKSATAGRLKHYLTYTQSGEQETEQIIKRKNRRESPFSMIGKLLVSGTFAKKVELQLMRAEIPMRGEEFLVLAVSSMLLAGFLGFVLLGGAGPGLVLFTITGAGLFFYVTLRKQKRFIKLNQQIGDALTVMSNSLRAGYSFQQAMDLASKEMTGPLSVEFKRTVREIHLGTPIEEALSNFNERVSSDDLELVITAVLIQRQIGGNLAEIFDNISYTIRERIRIKGEIKTLTAQGRMSGLIIGLMPPALFCILMLINPAYMSTLLTNPIGWGILVGGAISELIGILFIRKIIRIDV